MQTEYATGFSESEFRKVKVGDSKEKVVAMLGDPLFQCSAKISQASGEWLYRRKDSPFYAYVYSRSPNDGSYKIRTVIFDGSSNEVVDVISEFYVD